MGAFKTTLVIASILISASAFAGVSTFTCVSAKPFENDQVRTLQFRLSNMELQNVGVVSKSGRNAFKIVPRSDALRALNTADNTDISSNDDRIQIEADEIGMYHTTLVLWKKSQYRTGYLSTSGESNVKFYSPMSCQID